jgi:hypothetical protein
MLPPVAPSGLAQPASHPTLARSISRFTAWLIMAAQVGAVRQVKLRAADRCGRWNDNGIYHGVGSFP